MFAVLGASMALNWAVLLFFPSLSQNFEETLVVAFVVPALIVYESIGSCCGENSTLCLVSLIFFFFFILHHIE